MEPLETDDIQGLLVRAYGKLPYAVYLLLRITDAQRTREWLGRLVPRIATGRKGEHAGVINVAITWPGMKALGLPKQALDSFPRELKEGMHESHRQTILGDYGDGAPENWKWGNEANEVHLLLILIDSSDTTLAQLHERELAELQSAGLEVVRTLDTTPATQRKEHFGFHDGISQPIIRGLGKQGRETNTINAGEFILGYANQYEKLPDSPTVPAAYDPTGILRDPKAPAATLRDLGRNGSYLVFRQLEQRVKQFWTFIDEKTRNADGSPNPEARLLLASKMVGRWPSGVPLVKVQDGDPCKLEGDDNFLYHEEDPGGEKCPLGSHIRRCNPRDTKAEDPEESLKANNRHRILRRGRSYGPPLAPSMDPGDMLAAEEKPGESRGLHFICFNTSIARQFEFIQQTWINNPKFNGLYDDSDPMMGKPDAQNRDLERNFTIQQSPVRRRVTNLPVFVEMRGGSYFFFPGIRALRFMATANPDAS